MLTRFCLYGFLKNQRFFEPFLILVYLDRGLTFAGIGALVAAQQLTINLLEIPSGVLADEWGRRRTLIAAFVAYVIALALFGFARDVPSTVAAALLVAASDALRSGTHKALIFGWLRREGREAERTRIYGLTRSWSKIGSAVSIVIGAGIVIATGTFENTFLATLPLYVASIGNIAGYPGEIDVRAPRGTRAGERFIARAREAWQSLRGNRPLRRVVGESMVFHSLFETSKSYLQPALIAATAGAGVLLSSTLGQRAPEAAIAVAPAYLFLALFAGLASRKAHAFVRWCSSERRAMRRVWSLTLIICAALTVSGYLELLPAVVVSFLLLHVLQNLWRPIVVAEIDAIGALSHAATTLSVDSQAGRLMTMILAPILGVIVDAFRAGGRTDIFWPLGLVGLLASLYFATRRSPESATVEA